MAFLDEGGEEDKYDEEDIDKILERSSRVIKSENNNNNDVPSSFSKSEFCIR